MKKFFSLFLISSISFAETPVNRVGAIVFNKGKVEKIYLASGLGSVLIFPCFVDEAFLGRNSEITVMTSPKTKKNLLLSVKSSFSTTTNLIVRCEEQATPFVFDLVPSNSKHQDVVFIRSSFGSPELSSNELKLIESSDFKSQIREETPEKIVVKKPELFSEGETL